MAFATKYKTSIMNWDGDTITAEIQEDLFTDTLEEFSPVGKVAIRIEHQTNVNVKESYIIPSKATIRMYVTDEWDMHDLLYATDRQFKVIINNGSIDVFIGWVIAGINTEDYTTGQYMVKITAIDGLADLKNIPYLNSGALYDAFQSPLTVIQNCLAKTGLSLSLWENTDIYAAAGMTTTTNTHSPLNQSFVHSSAYGSTTNNTLSSFKVLEKVLQAFHCRIYQSDDLDPSAGNDIGWIMSKLDVIGSTKTYRYFSAAGAYDTFFSYNPLLTMGTGIQHAGGKGQLSIKQAYKEIIITTDRGEVNTLLLGDNFESDDFDGSDILINWGNTAAVFGNYAGGMGQNEYDEATESTGETVMHIRGMTPEIILPFTAVAASGTAPRTIFTVGIGHGIIAGDRILLFDSSDGNYEGVTEVAVAAASTLDCYITFVTGSTLETGNFFPIDKAFKLDQRLLYYGETDELSDEDILQVKLKLKTSKAILKGEVILPLGIYCNLGTGLTDDTYRLTKNDNGAWWNAELAEFSNTDTDQVLLCRNVGKNFSEYTININLNNITASGTSYEIYLAIFEPFSDGVAPCQIDTITARNINLSDEKETTTAIDSNVVKSLEVEFFHADGDGTANDEYKYNHPITDDATPKKFINSWQQDGAAADNLEDIIGANIADSYDENSQIWSGVIKGDINISNAIKDPLNFDRTFQIQKIIRNLETDYCNISMIEISPNRGYVVEQIGDDGAGGTYYFLSKTYGDISASFTAATGYNISKILNKSTSAVLDSGGNRTPDGASSFVSGRVRILVSDGDYTGADVECKGILRIL